MQRGFTLIEAVVYFALLSLIMASALLASYNLLESAGKTSGSNTVVEEGDFVMRKIDWALNGSSGASAITAPASGVYGTTLAATRTDGTQVRVRQTGSQVEISQNGGASYVPLTSSNVIVGGLQFYHIPPSGSSPEGVLASTTLRSAYATTSTFSTTRYVRK